MMIAVSCLGEEVAPDFATAPELAVYEVNPPRIGHRDVYRISEETRASFASLLQDLAVDLVIAGEVSPENAAMLDAAGVKLVFGVSGREGAVLAGYLDGTLPLTPTR